MRLIRRVFPIIGGVLALCLAGGIHAVDEEYVGDETCEACHEEVVAEFGLSGHAVAPGWDASSGCEACHGPGGAHAEGEEDAIVVFGDLSPREATARCLDCHDRLRTTFNAKQSIHRIADVGCTDCHNPHSLTEHGLKRQGAAVCSECHQTVTAQFDLPRSHPLNQWTGRYGGDVAETAGGGCANCHNPHANRTVRVNKSLFTEACGSCHFEKLGPFIYGHDVVLVDGCVSCHEVHGSPNRHLLRQANQVNLCYQCHSGAVTPPWHSAPQYLNQKCTSCHTAIHGSNTSPFFLEE